MGLGRFAVNGLAPAIAMQSYRSLTVENGVAVVEHTQQLLRQERMQGLLTHLEMTRRTTLLTYCMNAFLIS